MTTPAPRTGKRGGMDVWSCRTQPASLSHIFIKHTMGCCTQDTSSHPQATADLDELHREAGLLRTELENRQWELESLQSSLDAATAERDAALDEIKNLRVTHNAKSASGDARLCNGRAES